MSGDRPTRHRSAARVLVVADGRVLLQEDSDPGVAGFTWWVTPGGGIDAGEDAVAAAVRELWEETGLDATLDELRGPVAHRLVRHGYSDRVLIQQETFFRIDVEPFAPRPAGLTATERQRMRGHRWFDVDALPAIVWPSVLPRLLDWDGGPAIELGRMDESTVA